jgi:uncharacterized protein (TIGR02466 family)|tara:strand:+ start:3250 stop:3888 length:639 start_codon:yes stop_codon:yes gene_type:complete
VSAINYEVLRWGPCLVKTKITEEWRQLFLSEARASKKDFESRLAGMLKRQVEFRDSSLFDKFFSDMFKMYDHALQDWTGDRNIIAGGGEMYNLESLWANFQGPGDFNPPHSHGGALSWVIYLQIPDELTEENKQYKGTSAGPGGITFSYGDGPREVITYQTFLPQTGDMYIFPAWLQHWVYPFKSDVERISVSGNVTNSVRIKAMYDKVNKK